MKTLFLLGLLALTGCSSTNITKLTQALARDPAIVSARITSIYGVVQFTRVGSTNGSVTIGPDGTLSVKSGP